MSVQTYAPSKISISVAGVNVTGFAEDTFVTIERSAPTFTKQVGADGEVSRTHSADRSGTITIMIKQTSPTNDVLSALQIADEKSLSGKFPVLVKDTNGTSLFAAGTAWIEGVPTAEYAAEAGNREWIIHCAQLETFIGSND